MATVTISDSTYQRLKEVASAMSLPLDEYLDRIAAGRVQTFGDSNSLVRQGTSQWLEQFEAWVSSHAARPFIADDSRDAIYGDERD